MAATSFLLRWRQRKRRGSALPFVSNCQTPELRSVGAETGRLGPFPAKACNRALSRAPSVKANQMPIERAAIACDLMVPLVPVIPLLRPSKSDPCIRPTICPNLECIDTSLLIPAMEAALTLESCFTAASSLKVLAGPAGKPRLTDSIVSVGSNTHLRSTKLRLISDGSVVSACYQSEAILDRACGGSSRMHELQRVSSQPKHAKLKALFGPRLRIESGVAAWRWLPQTPLHTQAQSALILIGSVDVGFR